MSLRTMSLPSMLAGLLLALPLSALAETPNIVPGEWEFTSTTSVSGDLPFPDQTETSRECIAQGDLNDPDFQMIEEEENCELIEHNVGVDGMDYRMACQAEGGQADIVGHMDFLGETTEGRVEVTIQSPQMGEMEMVTEVEGRRVGDC
ncbi:MULTISPECIES: DUF3617 family protein [unclassified Halomonas]|uniref:DUF3617 domain-containing protein n=1 Tax=unclassified Halomonas TaxID=2609666 RepID=UPI002888C7D5|nr:MULTISPECIES: DUF3617 family protein [unclassified Halomonas]MDT0502360.1 DUF3617 family protein [Halomonas sp. PAR7]MDT0510921.1 DUF3617 family protein [Halomonas sp. LES1]MDT0592755.1 DUF3617 family protein [Halomonas sp. PAR8]